MKAANKLSSARLVYLDGAPASADFPLSNADTFVPGKQVEILAGAGNDPVTLFQGIVIKQSVKVRQNTAPQLVIECRHPAVKLTIARRSAYFFDQTDSDVMRVVLERAGIAGEIEDSTVTHPQQVQFASTDWDFLLMRAEANGRLIFTNDAKVTVKAPAFGAAAVCDLQFGATILEFDASMDARYQFNAVKGFTWDSGQQSVLETDAQDPAVEKPGNLQSDALAAVVGLDHYPLRHVAIAEEEAQAWADAEWLRSKLSRVSGRIKCEGLGTVNPGDVVNLGGVGERFSGPVFVTGVRHDFDLVQGWKTHIQFGSVESVGTLLASENTVSAPSAAALLPGVNGLQIGVVVSNEDPDGEHRVRVRMPLVSTDEDGTWARIASLDAGQERGFFFRPEVGDEVILGFLEDDPRQAVILGMLHSSAKPAPLKGSDDNHEKVYQSRSKLKLYFNDDTKVITLETPAGNSITLSEADKAIKITDQNGNKLEMTPDGITLESSKALALKAGTELKLESGTSLQVKGGTELKLEGTAGAEISSAAVTKVKGSLVQIN